MKLKLILVLLGASVAAAGLILGLESAARAIGIDSDSLKSHPFHPHQPEASHRIASNFSPDDFREDLLK